MVEIKERLILARMSPWILILGCVWTCLIIVVQLIIINTLMEDDIRNLVFLGLSILFLGLFVIRLMIIYRNLRKLDKYNDMLDKLIVDFDNGKDILGSLKEIIDKVAIEVEGTPFNKFNFQMSKKSNQSTLYLRRQMIEMKEKLEDVTMVYSNKMEGLFES